jgi:hypothetical protein
VAWRHQETNGTCQESFILTQRHLQRKQERAYTGAIMKMREHGAGVEEDVALPSAWTEFNINGKSPFYEIACEINHKIEAIPCSFTGLIRQQSISCAIRPCKRFSANSRTATSARSAILSLTMSSTL